MTAIPCKKRRLTMAHMVVVCCSFKPPWQKAACFRVDELSSVCDGVMIHLVQRRFVLFSFSRYLEAIFCSLHWYISTSWGLKPHPLGRLLLQGGIRTEPSDPSVPTSCGRNSWSFFTAGSLLVVDRSFSVGIRVQEAAQTRRKASRPIKRSGRNEAVA